MGPEEIVFIFGCITVSGLVQGMTGFGFGLTALALMSIKLDVKQASILIVFAGLILNLSILAKLWKHFRLEKIGAHLLSVLLGVPLGVWILSRINPAHMRLALGVLLLVCVADRLWRGASAKPWHPVYAGVPCGLLSGSLSGAFGTGGPPAVAFVASQGFDKFRYSASIQCILSCGTILRAGTLGAAGMFSTEVILISLCGALFAVAGAVPGLYILKNMPERLLKIITLIFLAIIGLRNILSV